MVSSWSGIAADDDEGGDDDDGNEPSMAFGYQWLLLQVSLVLHNTHSYVKEEFLA